MWAPPVTRLIRRATHATARRTRDYQRDLSNRYALRGRPEPGLKYVACQSFRRARTRRGPASARAVSNPVTLRVPDNVIPTCRVTRSRCAEDRRREIFGRTDAPR